MTAPLSDPVLEKWKPISGYEDLYAISNLGRVKSLPKSRSSVNILKQQNLRGYRRICLRKNGKPKSLQVHRLVLETFAGACPIGFEASHLNGNRADNRISNLVWESRKQNHLRKHEHGTAQNGERHSQCKLKESQIKEIFQAYKGWPVAGKNRRFGFADWVSKKYKIHIDYVYLIIRGRTWSFLQIDKLRAAGVIPKGSENG